MIVCVCVCVFCMFQCWLALADFFFHNPLFHDVWHLLLTHFPYSFRFVLIIIILHSFEHLTHKTNQNCCAIFMVFYPFTLATSCHFLHNPFVRVSLFFFWFCMFFISVCMPSEGSVGALTFQSKSQRVSSTLMYPGQSIFINRY